MHILYSFLSIYIYIYYTVNIYVFLCTFFSLHTYIILSHYNMLASQQMKMAQTLTKRMPRHLLWPLGQVFLVFHPNQILETFAPEFEPKTGHCKDLLRSQADSISQRVEARNSKTDNVKISFFKLVLVKFREQLMKPSRFDWITYCQRPTCCSEPSRSPFSSIFSSLRAASECKASSRWIQVHSNTNPTAIQSVTKTTKTFTMQHLELKRSILPSYIFEELCTLQVHPNMCPQTQRYSVCTQENLKDTQRESSLSSQVPNPLDALAWS